MQELIAAIILAVVQGITEWLPISSSGHLVLFHHILGYEVDVLFDIALHFGTLMAVFVYFGKDIVNILRAVLRLDFLSEEGKTGLYLIVATIPAAVVGYLFRDIFKDSFSNLIIVSLGFAITGVLLIIASLYFSDKKNNLRSSFIIGMAQAVSILPGISRSGSTLATGMILGLSPKAAARFSFLMAIPIIFGASILEVGNNTLPTSLIWATLISFFTGLFMIHLMFKYVLGSPKNLLWFGVYALILGFSVLFLTAFNVI